MRWLDYYTGTVFEAHDRGGDFRNILVTVFDENTSLASIELSQELHRNGFITAVYPQPGNIDEQFKCAGRIGSRPAVVIGLMEIIPEILARENGLC